MSLFEKKKSETSCCGGSCEAEKSKAAENKSGIKVLGSGCARCNALEKAVVEALESLHMDTTVEHVKDFAQIAAYGVMSTPGLVVDGKVVSCGKVLTSDEVAEILKKARG